MSNVRLAPLKLLYEGRLQEEGSFSGIVVLPIKHTIPKVAMMTRRLDTA